MFRKNTRRNFRQRKDESSDEEGQRDGDDGDRQSPSFFNPQPKLQKGRGLSCSSRPSVAEPESEPLGGEEAPVDSDAGASPQHKANPASVVSFSDEKEVQDGEFRVKKSTDKLVVFHVQKKESSPAKEIRSTGKHFHNVIYKTRACKNSTSGEDHEKDSDDGTDSTSSSTTSSRSPVSIPGADQILAAKEARRQARRQKDYIPLRARDFRVDTPMSDEEEGLEEDDEGDDQLDDHEREIPFAPKSKTLRERIAEEIGGSDGEEECKLWEQQQIGKGVKGHKEYQKFAKQKKRIDIPESLPPVSISVIKKRITAKLDSLREVHSARQAELRRMNFDMDSAKSSLEHLENSAANEQLKFYRSMSVYSQNLLDCLAEKVVLINAAEVDMHTAHIQQAEALSSRRRQAVREESSFLQQLLCESTVNCLLTQSRETGSWSEERCGIMPADSEPTPEEEAELQSKIADILKRSQDIFSDVHGDFCDIAKILARFDEWRRTFPDSYNNAYISLCLPKLLAPFIRHQLICWNPLESKEEDFEALPWYSAVETFCHGQGHEEMENMDKKTLPAIIEKTIVPKIQAFVELAWDPFSHRQSQSLTSLCRRLQEDYSIFSTEKRKPVQSFLESVSERLRIAVDEDVFIPLYPKKCLEDVASPQCKFRDQQFWAAVKLLENIGLWDNLIPEHTLKELALDKLLNRYLIISLLNESNVEFSAEQCKKVAACFPKTWFEENEILPQLKNFCSHVLQTVHSVCKDGSAATTKNLFIVLAEIGACDDLTAVVEKYNCKHLLDSLKLF
uniref:GCF C-terminal domain-containing protein n=1 Tax=Denticeps clupeoides TaxID=299321 RepID=A0AAY4D1G7_9TELE